MSLNERNRSGEENDRMKQYKNAGKHDDLRRRRAECSVELRKQKRENDLMKRRMITDTDLDSHADEIEVENTVDSISNIKKESKVKITPEEAVRILSNNPTLDQMRETFEAIRRLLSRTKSPPVDEVINAGLLGALVEGLKVPDHKVQFECAWSLTNVVSGTSAQTVAGVEAGCCPLLLELCKGSDIALADQCLWAMANIVGDSHELRDYTIGLGIIDVLEYMNSHIGNYKVETVRTIAWTLSNLCRHKQPHPPLDVMKKIFPLVLSMMQFNDKAVVQDACWALSYMTDGSDDQIMIAATKECIKILVAMISSNRDSCVAPALRVFGNFATGNDYLTQLVVDSGILKKVLANLIANEKPVIVKECAWLLSNILAGNQQQIQAVIDAGLLLPILTIFKRGDFKSIYEASWAVSNLVQGGTSKQIFELWKVGGLEILCLPLRGSVNNDVFVNLLDTIYGVLNTAREYYPEVFTEMKDQIEECGGLDTIEHLQQSESEKVYQQAYRIVSEFFNDDEEDDLVDENDQQRSSFNF
uniref:Importin subunit alpha n=1 Tax=Strongyloides papillosus TaxID=174720 RepID=A0A0N5B8G9_STREA